MSFLLLILRYGLFLIVLNVKSFSYCRIGVFICKFELLIFNLLAVSFLFWVRFNLNKTLLKYSIPGHKIEDSSQNNVSNTYYKYYIINLPIEYFSHQNLNK